MIETVHEWKKQQANKKQTNKQTNNNNNKNKHRNFNSQKTSVTYRLGELLAVCFKHLWKTYYGMTGLQRERGKIGVLSFFI